MRENLTQAIEDYLKAIYDLTIEDERASTNAIAERMGVKAGSVTGMIQKMASADPPLVEYQKHRGVVLTPDGKAIALEIIRHHRLLEMFLYEKLGFSWDEVHREADRLEHVISEDLEERIAQALGNPAHDPHGDPIPTREFHIPPHSTTRLSEMRTGQRAAIQRVDNEDPDLLRYLSGIGLVPQAQVGVLDYSEFDGNLRLQVEGQAGSVVLGPRVTQEVYVEDVEDD